MRNELVVTHGGTDRRGKLCKCSVCGKTAFCTPHSDFYGDDGEPLECEKCMMKAMGAEKMILSPEFVNKYGRPEDQNDPLNG